jgi:hypothetical protein
MGGIMAKYKESQVTVTEWVALGKAKFVFPNNEPTRVEFNEEQVRELNGSRAVTNRRELTKEFLDPQEKFILVDPDNNTPTGGDMSLRQLERAVYSLYYAQALARDAVEAGNG